MIDTGILGLHCRDLEHGVREFYVDGVRVGFMFYRWATPALREWCDSQGVDCVDVLHWVNERIGYIPHSPYLPHEILESWDEPAAVVVDGVIQTARSAEVCMELVERQTRTINARMGVDEAQAVHAAARPAAAQDSVGGVVGAGAGERARRLPGDAT